MLEIKIAKTAEDFFAASLVVPIYHKKGYYQDAGEATIERVALQMRERSGITTVLLATKNKVAEATVSLTPDTGEVPSDIIFKPEFDIYRSLGWKLMEFSDLAGRQERPLCRYILALQSGALRMAAEFGASALVASVNPDHEPFYCETLGFRRLADGEVRIHPKVNAKAIGIFSPIADLMCHRLAA